MVGFRLPALYKRNEKKDLMGLKTVLLTNIWLTDFGGSELNCLSLAKSFKELGWDVEVATLRYGDPLRREFEAENIPVKVVPGESLRLEHYDLIWGHHYCVLDQLMLGTQLTADRVILSSLSPFEPYEALPLYAKDCSLCLANSQETRDELVREGASAENIRVFPNYADASWLNAPAKLRYPNRPEKVAVVSNHVPPELLDVRRRLEEAGVQVDIFGVGYRFEKITPEILGDYDAVITIGKTVQFAMAMGIPVYCYDIWGGPGYLNRDNLDLAAYYNFSGRAFQKKNQEELAREILGQYQAALPDQPLMREYVNTHGNLERNLQRVLELVEGMDAPPVDCDGIRARYRGLERHSRALGRLFAMNEENMRQVRRLQTELEASRKRERQLRQEKEETAAQYETSLSWRVTRPVREARQALSNARAARKEKRRLRKANPVKRA